MTAAPGEALDATGGRAGAARASGRPVRVAVTALALLAVVGLGRAFVVAPLRVASDSMAPTLHQGDRVLVDKVGPRLRPPERGQLVTYRSPQDGSPVVKRVVGTAGDVVAMEDGLLVVDGRVVPEPYVDHSRVDGVYYGPVTVPAGHVLVLGDSRAGSIDSRTYGPVPLRLVTGRVVVRLGSPW